MNDVQEMTSRILSILEDRRWDGIHSVLNTIIDPTGSPTEIVLLKRVLQDILDRGLGTLALENFHPRNPVLLDQQQARELILALDIWFAFDHVDRYWKLGNGDPLKDQAPVLILTDKGMAAARDVLTRLGYDWWQSTK